MTCPLDHPDFRCLGVERNPVCPGFLARSIVPETRLINQTPERQVFLPGVHTCSAASEPPCKRAVGKEKCIFGDPCSPCFRIVHSRVGEKEQRDPCVQYRCDPCIPNVNSSPNLPLGKAAPWRPAPPVIRLGPETQQPCAPCPPIRGPCDPCPQPHPCELPCMARVLGQQTRSDTLHVPLPIRPVQPFRPCAEAPPVPQYTCASLGYQKCNERINHKYSYSGYLDTPGGSGSDPKCCPLIPCHMNSGYQYSDSGPKAVVFADCRITPPRCNSDPDDTCKPRRSYPEPVRECRIYDDTIVGPPCLCTRHDSCLGRHIGLPVNQPVFRINGHCPCPEGHFSQPEVATCIRASQETTSRPKLHGSSCPSQNHDKCLARKLSPPAPQPTPEFSIKCMKPCGGH